MLLLNKLWFEQHTYEGAHHPEAEESQVLCSQDRNRCYTDLGNAPGWHPIHLVRWTSQNHRLLRFSHNVKRRTTWQNSFSSCDSQQRDPHRSKIITLFPPPSIPMRGRRSRSSAVTLGCCSGTKKRDLGFLLSSFGFGGAYRHPFMFLTGPKVQVDLKDYQGALLLDVSLIQGIGHVNS